MSRELRPSKAALPRSRSAAARALARPEHRQRVIPDKRGKVEREQHRRDMKHPRARIERVIVESNPESMSARAAWMGCNHDNTGEYNCDHQPCILCLGPWARNK